MGQQPDHDIASGTSGALVSLPTTGSPSLGRWLRNLPLSSPTIISCKFCRTMVFATASPHEATVQAHTVVRWQFLSSQFYLQNLLVCGLTVIVIPWWSFVNKPDFEYIGRARRRHYGLH